MQIANWAILQQNKKKEKKISLSSSSSLLFKYLSTYLYILYVKNVYISWHNIDLMKLLPFCYLKWTSKKKKKKKQQKNHVNTVNVSFTSINIYTTHKYTTLLAVILFSIVVLSALRRRCRWALLLSIFSSYSFFFGFVCYL